MKFLKRLTVVLVLLFGLFYFVGLPYLRNQTKKYSPERTSSFNLKGTKLVVHYSSPSKKGRKIFGDLVPFDKVWRTGANEPTTFSTSQPIEIIDKPLSAGTYSLWTVPNKENWKVIFNHEVPDWGVTLLGDGTKTTRDASKDVISVEVPSKATIQPIENFTIDFTNQDQLYLSLPWDETVVNVPIHEKATH